MLKVVCAVCPLVPCRLSLLDVEWPGARVLYLVVRHNRASVSLVRGISLDPGGACAHKTLGAHAQRGFGRVCVFVCVDAYFDTTGYEAAN